VEEGVETEMSDEMRGARDGEEVRDIEEGKNMEEKFERE
jgi:hypothetical protein